MYRFLSLRTSGLAFFIAPALLGLSAAVAFAQSVPAAGQSASAIRGEYLAVHVAMCVECHSPRDHQGRLITSELFLGAPIPLADPPAGWATLAPKIARLPGSWSEEDVVRLLQTGQTRDGIPLRRPMPPFRFNREDAEAIAAFLKSVSSTK